MQYSSPLISSKLWAELATYVRQLCKISDRAHTQNLTGVEMRDKKRSEEELKVKGSMREEDEGRQCEAWARAPDWVKITGERLAFAVNP